MSNGFELLALLLGVNSMLLGIIAFFLRRHLTNVDNIQSKVDNHEVRISVLEKK